MQTDRISSTSEILESLHVMVHLLLLFRRCVSTRDRVANGHIDSNESVPRSSDGQIVTSPGRSLSVLDGQKRLKAAGSIVASRSLQPLCNALHSAREHLVTRESRGRRLVAAQVVVAAVVVE